MTGGPVVARPGGEPIGVAGTSFALHDWGGSGPPRLHVHHHDDEAWHVLAGSLRFRFADEEVDAPAGTSVFVPAGVAHTFETGDAGTRYLVVLPPRLHRLVAELQATPPADHAAVYGRHGSELLE